MSTTLNVDNLRLQQQVLARQAAGTGQPDNARRKQRHE